MPFRSAAADPSQPIYAPTNLPSNHRPVSVGLEAIDDNLLNVHGYNVALIIGLGMEQEGAQIPKRHRFLWNRPKPTRRTAEPTARCDEMKWILFLPLADIETNRIDEPTEGKPPIRWGISTLVCVWRWRWYMLSLPLKRAKSKRLFFATK